MSWFREGKLLVINRLAAGLMLACLLGGLPTFAVMPVSATQPENVLAIDRPLSRVGSHLQLSGLDCSHLVHTIYESVGLPYQYATSRVLYRGTDRFRRVLRPNPGDLVAWRGHVGIVVDPSRHIFLSVLRTGVKASSYLSDYWKHRGRVHFLRYASPVENPADSARVQDTASVALAAANSQ